MERVHSDPAVLCLQAEHINRLIRAAKRGDCLFGVEEIEDPSDKHIEVHLAVLGHAVQVLRAHSTRPGQAAQFGCQAFRAG